MMKCTISPKADDESGFDLLYWNQVGTVPVAVVTSAGSTSDSSLLKRKRSLICWPPILPAPDTHKAPCCGGGLCRGAAKSALRPRAGPSRDRCAAHRDRL